MVVSVRHSVDDSKWLGVVFLAVTVWTALSFHSHAPQRKCTILSQEQRSLHWREQTAKRHVTPGPLNPNDSFQVMERDKNVPDSSISLWKLVISYNICSANKKTAARITGAAQVSRNIHFRLHNVIDLYMDSWMTLSGDVMPASGYEVVWLFHSVFAFLLLVLWRFFGAVWLLLVLFSMWFAPCGSLLDYLDCVWNFRKHKQIYLLRLGAEETYIFPYLSAANKAVTVILRTTFRSSFLNFTLLCTDLRESIIC